MVCASYFATQRFHSETRTYNLFGQARDSSGPTATPIFKSLKLKPKRPKSEPKASAARETLKPKSATTNRPSKASQHHTLGFREICNVLETSKTFRILLLLRITERCHQLAALRLSCSPVASQLHHTQNSKLSAARN